MEATKALVLATLLAVGFAGNAHAEHEDRVVLRWQPWVVVDLSGVEVEYRDWTQQRWYDEHHVHHAHVVHYVHDWHGHPSGYRKGRGAHGKRRR